MDLIVTSPPALLVHEERYGNEIGEASSRWLGSHTARLNALLTEPDQALRRAVEAWDPHMLLVGTMVHRLVARFADRGVHELPARATAHDIGFVEHLRQAEAG